MKREYETKYRTPQHLSLAEVKQLVTAAFPEHATLYSIESRHTDRYYAVPATSSADFVRLRIDDNDSAEVLTVKKKDRGTNKDRAEVELELFYLDTLTFCNLAFGEPIHQLSKQYLELHLIEQRAVVSVALIEGTEDIFIEIEAKSAEDLPQLEERLKRAVTGVTEEARSIFELYVQPKLAAKGAL